MRIARAKTKITEKSVRYLGKSLGALGARPGALGEHFVLWVPEQG
jgi:hypothetical protein